MNTKVCYPRCAAMLIAWALAALACRAVTGAPASPAPSPSSTPPASLAPTASPAPSISSTVPPQPSPEESRTPPSGPLVAFADAERSVFYFVDPATGQKQGDETAYPEIDSLQRYRTSPSSVYFFSDGALHVLKFDGATQRIPAPDANPPQWDGIAHDALLSPDEQKIVWRFEKTRSCDSFPCPRDAWLVLTDSEGREASLLLADRGDEGAYTLHYLVLLSWRADSKAIYFARAPEMMAAAYFKITPNVSEVTLDGRQRALSRLDEKYEGGESAVSPDGRYLAEAVYYEQGERTSAFLSVTDLRTEDRLEIATLEGYTLLGDLRFSPDGRALSWTEASFTEPPGTTIFVTRLYYPDDAFPGGMLFLPTVAEGMQYPRVLEWLDTETLIVYQEGAVYAYTPYSEQRTFLSNDLFLGILRHPLPDAEASLDALPYPEDAEFLPVVEGLWARYATEQSAEEVYALYDAWALSWQWQPVAVEEIASLVSLSENARAWRRENHVFVVDVEGTDTQGRTLVSLLHRQVTP